jgi:hypothetical protein
VAWHAKIWAGFKNVLAYFPWSSLTQKKNFNVVARAETLLKAAHQKFGRKKVFFVSKSGKNDTNEQAEKKVFFQTSLGFNIASLFSVRHWLTVLRNKLECLSLVFAD